jgi:rod shape-determining protein MreD
MINMVSRNIIRFIFLVLFQVAVLNNIHLGGYVNPYLYLMFILMLPFETPKWLLLVSAFLLGISVDMFSDTVGLHAAACVLMAYCRPGVLKIVNARQEYEPGFQPTVRDLGFKWYFSYSLILVIIHHVFLFYLEVFSFSEFFQTLFRACLSILFTMLLLILSQYILYHPKK